MIRPSSNSSAITRNSHLLQLDNWRRRRAWFSEGWKPARKNHADFLVKKCADLAKTATPQTAHLARVQFDIYRWLASKFHPDAYGDKPQQRPPTNVNLGVSISPERLNEIRSKLDQTRLSPLTLTLRSNLTLPPRTVAPLQTAVRSLACARDADPALGIVDHLRRRFARFKLGAHFLDLRCLLLSWAVRVSICFCCCATVDFSSPMVACCSSTLRLSMVWCRGGAGARGPLRGRGAL